MPGQGMKDEPDVHPHDRRFVELAVAMDAIPSQYLRYFYFHDEMLAELQAKPTTRSEDILAQIPDYWAHYIEQSGGRGPGAGSRPLTRRHLRAGAGARCHGLLLQRPGAGAPVQHRPTLVVRSRGSRRTWSWKCSRAWIATGSTPRHIRHCRVTCGVSSRLLGEYQVLTAEAAWSGTRRDAIRALASHPWMLSLHRAERLYDEMAAAHRAHLPERLLT